MNYIFPVILCDGWHSGARKCIDLVLGVPPVWGLSPRGPRGRGIDLAEARGGGGGGGRPGGVARLVVPDPRATERRLRGENRSREGNKPLSTLSPPLCTTAHMVCTAYSATLCGSKQTKTIAREVQRRMQRCFLSVAIDVLREYMIEGIS